MHIMPLPVYCPCGELDRGSGFLLGKASWADQLLGSFMIDSFKPHEMLGWNSIVSMDEQLK
jgi:hypothetical protein